MPDSVDAATVRRWCAVGLDALRRHQVEIDALNVYPVPDGDTGTNLVLTMAAVVEAVGAGPEPVAAAGHAAAGRGSGSEDAERLDRDSAVSRRADAGKGSGSGDTEDPDSSVPKRADAGGGPGSGGTERLERDSAVSRRADADGGTAGHVLRSAARGALLGARGNSGIILAQLFKGLAAALDGVVAADGAQLARALDEAARSAYRAVAAPVEGTVLSVGAAAAAAALAAVDGAVGPRAGASAASPGGAIAVAKAAADAARVALARTPEQLPALARAGVVDAGGRGLVVVLDALVETLTGQAPPPTDPLAGRPGSGVSSEGTTGSGTSSAARPGGMMEREAGSDEYAYEVQYLLQAPAEAVETLRRVLAGLGDSLVVVGDESTWHIHVHVNDVGAAIEAGVDAGRPSRITVTRFADQIAARADAGLTAGRAASAGPVAASVGPVAASAGSVVASARPAVAASAPASAGPGGSVPEPLPRTSRPGGQGDHHDTAADGRGRAADEPQHVADGRKHAVGGRGPGLDERDEIKQERAVVVVCSGLGLAELLEAEGAAVLTGSPSTGEILDAIRGTGAARVVVLPNDSNVQAVASAAAAEARAEGIRAGVVPTRSPVQALAALAVRDDARRFEDDVIAMAEAAARCRSAEVTIAGREALTVAGRCQPGDVLAIVDGEVNLIGQDLSQTACQLLDRMLTGGGELVTLIAGQGAPEGLAATLQSHVEGSWPFVEVQCYEGGQPHYPLLVGVE